MYRRRAPPVVFVCLQHNPFAAARLDKSVRPCSDRRIEIACVAHLVVVRLAAYAAQSRRHAEQKARIRRAQIDVHGIVVHDLAAFEVHKQRRAQRARRALVERELDVLGGKVVAVVKLHALTQVKRIAQPVLRQAPAFRQSRRYRAVRLQERQAIVHIAQHQVVVACAALVGQRVKMIGFAGRGQND